MEVQFADDGCLFGGGGGNEDVVGVCRGFMADFLQLCNVGVGLGLEGFDVGHGVGVGVAERVERRVEERTRVAMGAV